MKIILLLAILFISTTAFAGEKKNKNQSVTNTLSKPTHLWIINLDKVSKQTKNISMLQPVLAVMKAVSRPQQLEIKKQKSVYL